MHQEFKRDSLISFSKNINSQYGEDGMIEKTLELIGNTSKWCVEFGAWDGKHLSNTHYLMTDKDWSGVFIEGDKKKFKDLELTYSTNNKATSIYRFVSFEGKNSLDNILQETKIPRDFGLLCIDIDGNDYHIWDSLSVFLPRLVVVEFNPSIPAHIEYIQKKDMNVNQGSSLLSLYKLGKRKGYELVGATSHNAFFVKKEDFSKFGIEDNDPSVFKDKKYESYIFQLYDGTLELSGAQRFLWHGMKIYKSQIQIIPKIFRKYPGIMGSFRSILFKIWRKIFIMFSTH